MTSPFSGVVAVKLADLVAGGNAAVNRDVIVELIAQFDRIVGD